MSNIKRQHRASIIIMTQCFDMVSYKPNSLTVLRHSSSSRAFTTTVPVFSDCLRPTSGFPLGERSSGPIDGIILLNNVLFGCLTGVSSLPLPIPVGLLPDSGLAFRSSLSTRSNSSITTCGLQNSVRFICPSRRTTFGSSSEEKPITSTAFALSVEKLNSDLFFSSTGGRGMSEGSMAMVVCAIP
jgi:hypothetical protein